ncbi:MAG: hypothetical protein ACYDAJ_10055 [Nitrosotalea sp.]
MPLESRIKEQDFGLYKIRKKRQEELQKSNTKTRKRKQVLIKTKL